MKNTVFVIALSLLAFLCSCARRAPAPTPKPATAAPAREERSVITYEGEDGKTVLELLKARARVRTTTSSLGELVEEINCVASGNGSYLILFVNGEKAMKGAGSFVTRNGDHIEWKLIGSRKTQ